VEEEGGDMLFGQQPSVRDILDDAGVLPPTVDDAPRDVEQQDGPQAAEPMVPVAPVAPAAPDPFPLPAGPPMLLAGQTKKASKNLLSHDPCFMSPPVQRAAKTRSSRPVSWEPDPIVAQIEKMRKEIDRKVLWAEQDASEISRALGFVFRVIDEFSWEGKHSPAVEKAVQEEFQGLLNIGAFDLRDVREWSDVTREDPRAKHASTRFVLGQKNAELDESRRRMKARMVVGGHNVRDASGQRCVDVLHHIVPVGMTSIRLCHAHAAAFENGKTREADIVQAYPKAPLGGDPVWISLPKRVVPAAWAGMVKPVLPLRRTLYGLQRAGFDFGMWLREVLTSKSWSWIRDIGDTSLYVRNNVLLAVYTDDLKFAGPYQEVDAAFNELHSLVGFSEKSLQGDSDAAFIGIEAENWGKWEGINTRHFIVRLHQSAYAAHVARSRHSSGYGTRGAAAFHAGPRVDL
jgi:hypothetical protein